MPRVNNPSRPPRRPRLEMLGGRVREYPDGSTRYDRRDFGVVNVGKDGTPMMGFTTGAYGSSIGMQTVARELGSTVRATGGKYARPGHRRMRHGNRPGQCPRTKQETVDYRPLLDARTRIHIDLCMGRGGQGLFQRFAMLDSKLWALVPQMMQALAHKDRNRERCLIGQLERQAPHNALKGRPIKKPFRVFTRGQVGLDEYQPRPWKDYVARRPTD